LYKEHLRDFVYGRLVLSDSLWKTLPNILPALIGVRGRIYVTVIFFADISKIKDKNG